MEDCLKLIKEDFPAIDADIEDYVSAVLDSTCEDLEAVDDVFDGIGEVLHGVDPAKTEKEIRELCARLCFILKPNWTENSTPSFQQRVVPDSGYGDQRPDLVTTELETAGDAGGQESQLQGGSEQCVEATNEAAKGGKSTKKRRGKETKLATRGKNKYGSNEVTVAQRETERHRNREKPERVKEFENSKDVRLEDFDICYGAKELILNADFTIEQGRRYGLVGRNGIGKTVLLRCISDGHLKLPDRLSCLHVEQEVEADSRSALQAVLESDMEREVLLKEEEMLTAKLEAGDEEAGNRLTEVFEKMDLIEADSAHARASIILTGLGFTLAMQEQQTKEFSGGWRMRIALAQALFCRPDLLMLDEPTNMLDMQAVIWLENHLKNWPKALLLVSHDRTFLDQVVTDILHLHNKRVHTFRGNYTEYLEAASDLETGKFRENTQMFIDKNKYKLGREIVARVQAAMKMLNNLPVMEKDPVKFSFAEGDFLKGPILSLNEVSFRYPDADKPILNKVNLSIEMDTKVGFVGQNGSGKTTLINLLLERLVPTEGRRSAHKHLRISHFTQHFVDQLDLEVCPVELLQRHLPGLRHEEYRKMLGQFGVGGSPATQQIATLSGGQKARVAVAVLASTRPNCLIMDEPTNHLDIDTVEALAQALREFKGGVVLVSHDQNLLQSVCHQVWVCQGGTVKVEQGGVQEYRRRVVKAFS